MRAFRILMRVALIAALTACGGGGGGGDSTQPAAVVAAGADTASQPVSVAQPASQPAVSATAGAASQPAAAGAPATPVQAVTAAQAPISGFIVAGPVSGASVALYSVDASGKLTLLAQTTSAADGSYGFQVTPAEGSVFMVSANGGTYRDEATLSNMLLSTPLRALDIWNGPSRRVSPTVYSEVAVRATESAQAPDWSTAGVQASSGLVAARLGISGLLDFSPVDLSTPSASANATAQDLSMSLFVSMASTYGFRIDAAPATSLASAIQSLYDLLLADPDDD